MQASSRTDPIRTEPAGDVFRDTEDARQFMTEFVPYFQGCSQVLDVACGWGLFLDHLRAANIGCQGIDHHAPAVVVCRDHGHDVELAEAHWFLTHTEARWDGIMLSHIIEHFDGAGGRELLSASWDALNPGGVLVVVTPNLANPNVRRYGFWSDPTHVQPFDAAQISNTLLKLGADIRFSGSSRVEHQRYRRRFRRNPVLGAFHWTANWAHSGGRLNFMLGDVVVVARRP